MGHRGPVRFRPHPRNLMSGSRDNSRNDTHHSRGGGVTGHIGIIACSAEGAALCYRTICLEAAHRLGRHAHPEVSLHNHSLASYVACLERRDWPAIAELMLSSAHKWRAPLGLLSATLFYRIEIR